MRRTLSVALQAERHISRSPSRPYICTSCRRSLLQYPVTTLHPRARYASSISAADPSLRNENPDFVPASTWDGLDHVGLEPPTSDYEFTAFSKEIQPSKLLDPIEIANAVHQAAVEVFTLQAAGKDLDLSHEVLEHTHEAYRAIRQTQVHARPETGEAVLSYPDEAAGELIAKELAGEGKEDAETESLEADSVTESEAIETDSTASQPISPDSFNAISLKSLPIKFALVKRITHLTGHRILDPTLNALTTLGSVYDYLLYATKPKPKKLADRLLTKEDLTKLPNIKISREKQTIIQREQSVGRLKVINEELRSRGLPAIGERFDG